MLRFREALLCATILLHASASTLAAEGPAIELGAPFCDNAILQREMPVPVWGWSDPGTAVTVEFAGQRKSATAGADGRWTATLDPLRASAEPAVMVITDTAGRKVTLGNVLVGEVWMASGQSNMQWPASKCDVGTLLKRVEERVKAGEQKPPIIREFGITSVFSALHPVEHAVGAWATEDKIGGFSGIATAFASELSRELGVPIGILNCSFSQTSIQAWTPRAGFRDGTDDYTKTIYRRILETDPTTPEHAAAWGRFFADMEEALARNAALVKDGKPAVALPTGTPGNLGGDRDASWMFNGRMNPVVPYAIRGAIWNQGYANIGEGFHYDANLHSLIRGWREAWGRDLPVCYHQFYAPGANDGLSLNPAHEMRLGAWKARDIPGTGMACQIDIAGEIHYVDKALPGKRLALQALKNQYGRAIVADGPMFKSCEVDGDRLIVHLDFAAGGLQVGRTTSMKTLDGPEVIPDGDDQVKLFYLAGEDRVWHRAAARIVGETVVLTAPGVAKPRGVAYACNGAGWQPNIYNRALLPLAPFIVYDDALVLSTTWPDAPIKVAGVEVDSATLGKRYDYRKMPLLSQMFRDNAVLQAGMPVTIWGSTVHASGAEADGVAEIRFSFAGIEKTITVTPGMREWQVTVPPLEASAEPRTLKVTFTIDGELVHERVCTNIVTGDVWYVAGDGCGRGSGAAANGPVRVMARGAKELKSPWPHRFSVCPSTLPTADNRFASWWRDVDGGLAEALGRRIHEKTGKPVGIVCMEADGLELMHWMAPDSLGQVPALADAHAQLATTIPGTPQHEANARRYLAAWKTYWGETIPRLMKTKRLPANPGYPDLGGSVTTEATQGYNMFVHCFWPAGLKGIVFLSGKATVAKDEGASFGEHLAALANGWKRKFGCPDPVFVSTLPSAALAPKITRPAGIEGRSVAVEIDAWPAATPTEAPADAAAKRTANVVDAVVRTAYP